MHVSKDTEAGTGAAQGNPGTTKEGWELTREERGEHWKTNQRGRQETCRAPQCQVRVGILHPRREELQVFLGRGGFVSADVVVTFGQALMEDGKEKDNSRVSMIAL